VSGSHMANNSSKRTPSAPLNSGVRAHMQLPEYLAGFIQGLSAASNSVWDQGGLQLEIVAADSAITWQPQAQSTQELLLEFFACICGNRLGERTHEALPCLKSFTSALGQAFPGGSCHLQVEELEGSWAYRLHCFVKLPACSSLYFRLGWSVD